MLLDLNFPSRPLVRFFFRFLLICISLYTVYPFHPSPVPCCPPLLPCTLLAPRCTYLAQPPRTGVPELRQLMAR